MAALVLLRVVLCLAGAAHAHAAAAGKLKPHIFHVIVDDLGFSNTNYNRGANDSTPEVQTPFMDALVEEGIRLDRHYVHAMCTPTRVSFQTGRVPAHSG